MATQASSPSASYAPTPAPGVRPLSLRANFSWTFVGNLINAACQWGILTALAKLGSPEAVGQFALGLAVSGPILMLTMLQLRAVQATDAREEYDFDDYFGLRITTMILAAGLVAAWSWFAGYEAVTAWVVFWVGIGKCADGVIDVVRGLFQRHERMDMASISFMVKAPFSLAALTLVYWQTGSIVLAVAAIAVIRAVSFTVYDLPRATKLLGQRTREEGRKFHVRPRFDPGQMLQLTWVALPLGIVMFILNLQVNIPRLLLKHTADTAALGYFAALAYPMVAGTMIVNALGQSAAPRLARYYIEDLRKFKRLLRQLQLLGAGLGAAGVLLTALVGYWVLWLIYAPDYARYYREFVIISIAVAFQFNASFCGYALTAGRVFRAQAWLSAITCAVTTIVAFILVPWLGILGAALTTVATGLSSWIVQWLAVQAMVRGRWEGGGDVEVEGSGGLAPEDGRA